MRKRLSTSEYIDGILGQNRAVLAKAITLIESALPSDRELAAEVLSRLMPHTDASVRIGLTGSPGVGKSTFIDEFGTFLTEKDYSVAVLAVDPSSSISRGSILGDKTRMNRLSLNNKAFIRPSPSGGSLGGVTRRTRESMLLCEAFGFDLILVETVGVGQSELAVHSMVDFFLLLMLPGAGDELQGIKKGIIEMADSILINKADGSNLPNARIAKANYSNALKWIHRHEPNWQPEVLLCSALEGTGIPEAWKVISGYLDDSKRTGEFRRKRSKQALKWMHETVGYLLEDQFFAHPEIKNKVQDLEAKVMAAKLPPTIAAKQLIDIYFAGRKNN